MKFRKMKVGNREVSTSLNLFKDFRSWYDEMNDYYKTHDLPTSNLIFPTIYGNQYE
ncbi:MAG: hypothetical protein ACK5LM_03070 [Lactovum sp.]